MRRYLWPIATIVLLLASPQARAETTVKLASAQNSVGSAAIVVAEQKGFFKEEGLAIETLDFKGGGPAVQALASGSVDLCVCAADHALRLESRGLSGRILVALTERHGYALLARKDTPYTDLASLKGQKLGITSAGSLTDNSLRFAIVQAGLDPDTDFELISVGTGGPMRAAVESGAVAAGMFTTPDVQANLHLSDTYKVAHDFRVLNYPALDLLALESWLEDNPEAARGVARAVVRAQALIQEDPKAIREAMAVMFPSFTPELTDLVADEAVNESLARDGKVGREGYDTMLKVLAVSDPALADIAYDTVVAGAYLPQ